MREDPIIYEDWEIGSSSLLRYWPTKLLNFGMSFAYIVAVMSITLQLNTLFPLYVHIFFLLFVFLIEIVFDQGSRTILDQIVVFFLFPFLLLMTSIEIRGFLTAWEGIIMLISLIGKITLIPILYATTLFTDDILVPKTEKVSLVLDEQIARLADTDYKVSDSSDFMRSLSRLRWHVLQNFSIAAVLMTLVFIGYQQNQQLTQQLTLILILICSTFFGAFIIIWYLLNRRDEVKSPEEEDENVPVFAE